MKFSYIKLNAQKRFLKNQLKSTLISFLPYVTIISLATLNYYLYFFLKNIDFGFIPFISSYDVYVKASLFTLSVIASIVLWIISQLHSQKYFFSQTIKKHIKLHFRQYLTAVTVSILKFFLSISWSTFYLMPFILTATTLYYSIISKAYKFNVMLTLFVASVILFIIGISFLYVTLKRYSMCYYVIFSTDEKNSLKVIAKSIELMEGNTARYAFYCLSFIGWLLSCVLIIPIFYVLPYNKMAKYSFYKAITMPQKTESEVQKPIIFYFSQKEKV